MHLRWVPALPCLRNLALFSIPLQGPLLGHPRPPHVQAWKGSPCPTWCVIPVTQLSQKRLPIEMLLFFFSKELKAFRHNWDTQGFLSKSRPPKWGAEGTLTRLTLSLANWSLAFCPLVGDFCGRGKETPLVHSFNIRFKVKLIYARMLKTQATQKGVWWEAPEINRLCWAEIYPSWEELRRQSLGPPCWSLPLPLTLPRSINSIIKRSALGTEHSKA